MNRLLLSSLVATSLLFCIGCDNAGGKKAVSGTVTLKGVPLDSGKITFTVPEGQKPEAEALITQGKYTIPAESGLLPGKYRVKLTAQEGFDITPEELAAGKTAPPARERIPPQYNIASQEIVEVKADTPNQFDYKID